MIDREYWTKLLSELLVYAAQNPWQFIQYVLLILSPLFLLSAFLSYKLAKAIEKEKSLKKAQAKRQNQLEKLKQKQTAASKGQKAN